jgi:hypothetical protein
VDPVKLGVPLDPENPEAFDQGDDENPWRGGGFVGDMLTPSWQVANNV